jgi:hypothetical protein
MALWCLELVLMMLLWSVRPRRSQTSPLLCWLPLAAVACVRTVLYSIMRHSTRIRIHASFN